MAQSSVVTGADVLRVLILVRYFPPSGGSGAQRWARLAKYLSRKTNITVDVVTTTLLAEGTAPDPELAADLPPSVTVTRVPARVSTMATETVAKLHLGFAYYRGLRLLGAPAGRWRRSRSGEHDFTSRRDVQANELASLLEGLV